MTKKYEAILIDYYAVLNVQNETKRWRDGWAFYKSNWKHDECPPPVGNCVEWIKGNAAAIADYDLEPYREHHSIQAALLHHGIVRHLLKACLLAVETVCGSGDWCRWPSVPVRGFENLT
jgi:hypothetical protein